MPFFEEPGGPVGAKYGGVGRRRGRVAQLVADANRCVEALNSLYSNAAGCGVKALGVKPSAAQQKCMDNNWARCREVGRPPVDLPPAEALSELRLMGPYEEISCGRVAFDPDLVSLPPAGTIPVPLEKIWGEGGESLVERFVADCVLPSERAEKRLQSDGPEVPFVDPLSKKGAVFGDLIARMWRSGMLECRGGGNRDLLRR